MPRRPAVLLSVFAVAAVVAAGCGASNDAPALPTNAATVPASQTTSTPAATPAPAPASTPQGSTAAPAAGGGKPAGGAQKVALTADMSQLKWVETMLGPVKAGAIEIDMTNPSAIPHNVAIQDQNGMQIGPTGATIMGGATDTLKVDLQPGTYKVVCLIPGHTQTMNIPLTVE